MKKVFDVENPPASLEAMRTRLAALCETQGLMGMLTGVPITQALNKYDQGQRYFIRDAHDNDRLTESNGLQAKIRLRVRQIFAEIERANFDQKDEWMVLGIVDGGSLAMKCSLYATDQQRIRAQEIVGPILKGNPNNLLSVFRCSVRYGLLPTDAFERWQKYEVEKLVSVESN